MNIKLKSFGAFTLAEMMVVLLIITVVLAAMAPIVTTRMRHEGGSGNSPWFWASNNIDAYFGRDNDQMAMIGQAARVAGLVPDPKAKLIINSKDDELSHILFKRDRDVLGSLNFAGNDRMLLGTKTGDSFFDDSTFVGINNSFDTNQTLKAVTVFGQDNSIDYNRGSDGVMNSFSRILQVGFKNTTEALHSVQVGASNTLDSSAYALMLGNDNETTKGTYAISIGSSNKITRAKNGIAIGYEANVENPETSPSNQAIEYQTGFLPGPIAIGNKASAVGYHNSNVFNSPGGSYTLNTSGIAIGNGAKSENGGIALGSNEVVMPPSPAIKPFAYSTEAIGRNAIAIGVGAMARGQDSIAIGRSACSYVQGANKICIGANSGPDASSPWAKASDSYERIFIGSKSKANDGAAILEIHNIPGEHNSTTTFNNDSGMRSNSAVVVNAPLIVNGPIYFKAAENHDYTVNWGYLYTTNFINASRERDVLVRTGDSHPLMSTSSDRRLKYVGAENKSGLDKIRQMKIYNYTFKKDPSKEPRIGVMAQDLQKILPNAVKKATDGFLTIRPEDILYTLVNAVKELDAKVTEILKQVQNDRKEIQNNKKEIELLKKENKELKARLDRLENSLKKLQ